MIISTLVSITLITLLIEIRSKELIYFILIFPQSDKQRNGIFMIIIHHRTRSGQGEAGVIVSKTSNVDTS